MAGLRRRKRRRGWRWRRGGGRGEEGGRGGEGVREADHQQKVTHATSPATEEPDVERNLTLQERMFLDWRCKSDISSVTWKPKTARVVPYKPGSPALTFSSGATYGFRFSFTLGECVVSPCSWILDQGLRGKKLFVHNKT